MKEQKLRNFYEMLSIREDASDAEIEKAYRKIMERVRVHVNAPILQKQFNLIYEVLKNPAVRKRYDTLLSAKKRGEEVLELDWEQVLKEPGGFVPEDYGKVEKKRKWTAKELRIALGVLVIILVISFFIFVFPKVSHKLVSFGPGDQIYSKESGTYFGKIIEYEGRHKFPNGALGEAYLVELESRNRKWLPAEDLRKSFRKD